MIWRSLPITIIACAAGVYMSRVNSGVRGASDLNVLFILLPVFAISIGVGIYRKIRHQKTLMDSYTLTVLDNLISREQVNTPTVAIYTSDIREIFRHRNGSYIVRGKNAVDMIVIPSQIERYDELAAALESIRPVTAKNPQSLMMRYVGVLALVNLVFMLTALSASGKIPVAIGGIGTVAVTTWSFVATLKSKNVDRKTKRSVWWALPVMIWVVVVVITKLTTYP